MRFEKCQGRRITFHELSNRNSVFREFNLSHSSKIENVVDKTVTQMALEDRQAFEYRLRNGLGAITLTVTGEQHRKLLR